MPVQVPSCIWTLDTGVPVVLLNATLPLTLPSLPPWLCVPML